LKKIKNKNLIELLNYPVFAMGILADASEQDIAEFFKNDVPLPVKQKDYNIVRDFQCINTSVHDHLGVILMDGNRKILDAYVGPGGAYRYTPRPEEAHITKEIPIVRSPTANFEWTLHINQHMGPLYRRVGIFSRAPHNPIPFDDNGWNGWIWNENEHDL
jgi:hypothetical protein